MDFVTITNGIILIIGSLTTLAGKLSFDKLIKHKSKNEILIETLNKNTEALTELYNLISISTNKILIDNQAIADLTVERFSHSLKHDFIIEVYDIYIKNHLSDSKTIPQLNNLVTKLINKFYSDLLLVPNINTYVNSKSFTLSLINNCSFSSILYNVLIECKQNVSTEYEIKRMLENVFDEMFGVCYNTKEIK